MTHIKICGIKEEEHALEIAAAGVDLIGFVFAPSPRQVTTARAKKIISALKNAEASIETVGVFVNRPFSTVKRTAESCNLDWVQLNGDEPWEYCRELGMPIIKVIRVSRHYQPEQILADLDYGTRVLGKQKHIFLLDANARDKYGGTGKKFDWNLAKLPARKFPVIVAGGLTPRNVADAIKTISPWGVDVSTGVETKGVKDLSKIKKFIEAVRESGD